MSLPEVRRGLVCCLHIINHMARARAEPSVAIITQISRAGLRPNSVLLWGVWAVARSLTGTARGVAERKTVYIKERQIIRLADYQIIHMYWRIKVHFSSSV